MPYYAPSSGASAITIKDEGSALSTAASTLDFVGAGVTASGTTADKTITIPGGSNQRASITAASAAIANTETVVVSASLAASYMSAGMSFRIRAAGVGTTGATAGADTFRIRIGPTTLTGNVATSVAPTANDSVTAQAFGFEAIVTVRTTGATGTIIGECQALGDNATTGLFTTLNDLSATTATVAVDTTVANLLELTFQSGSAGSSCTFHTATIEVLSSGSSSSSLTDQGSFTYLDGTVAGAPATPASGKLRLYAKTGNVLAVKNDAGTETELRAGALVLLQSQTASASASLDFTTSISSTYDEYMIELVNVLPATNAVSLLMRMSKDGGATYDSGANKYSYASYRAVPTGSAAAGNTGTATSIIVDGMGGGDTVTNTAAQGGVSGSYRLANPLSTTVYKFVVGTVGVVNNANAYPLVGMTTGIYIDAGAVDAFQFLFSSGNIASGTIRVYGIAKS